MQLPTTPSRSSLHKCVASSLQTLSRLLRDDYKKSGELCLNLVSVFFSLSHFAQFHPLLVQVEWGGKAGRFGGC